MRQLLRQFINGADECPKIFEEKLLEKNHITLLVALGILAATDSFWIVVTLFTNLTHIRFSGYVYLVLVAVVALSLLLMAWTCRIIKKKNYLSLRLPILILDSVIMAEVVMLFIHHNQYFSLSQGARFFYLPLASIYLFIYVFLPLVKLKDSAYIMAIALLTVLLPNIVPGMDNYSPLPGLIMVCCIIVIYFAYRYLMMRYVNEELNLKSQQDKLLKLTNESLETVAATIDAKNEYLKGHSKRVAEYSKKIADSMGLSPQDSQTVYFAGLLHDIGKISIPNRILDNTGMLSEEEYALIKQHSTVGAEILENMSALPELAQTARWHHERWDGDGYPDGLRGEEIPLFVRIICLCDAYDAMSSPRSYRRALSGPEIYRELIRCRGTQFDPKVLDVLLGILTKDEDITKF